MGVLKNYILDKHNSVKRDYLDRMLNNKPRCVKLAKKFGYEYWDESGEQVLEVINISRVIGQISKKFNKKL